LSFEVLVHPVNAYLYYLAVIARSIEGDESDAAIPGEAEKVVAAPSGRPRDRFTRIRFAMTSEVIARSIEGNESDAAIPKVKS